MNFERDTLLTSADNGSITRNLTMFSRPDRSRRHVKTTDSPSPLITASQIGRQTRQTRGRRRFAVAATLFRTRERTRNGFRSPASNYRARICMKVKEKKSFSPPSGGKVIPLSLFRSPHRARFAIFGCDRRMRVFEYEIAMIIICGNNKRDSKWKDKY